MIGTIAVTLEDVSSAIAGEVSVYVNEVLSNDAVAYWRLGEAAGPAAADSSVNSSPGVYVGTLNLGDPSLVPSESDTAVDFVSGRVTIASTTEVDDIFATGGSIEGWLNTDSLASTATPINKEDGASGWGVQLTTAGRLTLFQRGTALGQWASTTPTITVGTTFHFVITYDVSGFPTSDPIIYLNGVESSTAELNAPSGTEATDTGLPAAIGQRVATTFPFNGVLDDIVLYKTILTPSEVLGLFNAGSGVVAGTVASTLEDVSSVMSGAFVDVVGTIALTLEDTDSAISGTVASVVGTIAVTLDDVSSAIQGAVEVDGTIAETLDNVSSAMTGTSVFVISGTIAETLDNVVSNISGVFTDVAGTIAVTLDDVTPAMTGSFALPVIGTIALTLEDTTSAISGGVDAFTGTIAVTLEDVQSFMFTLVPITLNWQDNSTNELEFRIYRRDVPDINFVQVGTVAADVTTFVDSVSAGSFEYKISARNVLGETFSNTASIIVG